MFMFLALHGRTPHKDSCTYMLLNADRSDAAGWCQTFTCGACSWRPPIASADGLDTLLCSSTASGLPCCPCAAAPCVQAAVLRGPGSCTAAC